MEATTDKFESWAKVELFGHAVIVGKVSEASIGGCSFMRVDVPPVGDKQGYTRFFGNGAIYAMTPCSEEVAMRLLNTYHAAPINAFELRVPPAAMLRDANVDTGPDDDDDDDGSDADLGEPNDVD